MTNTDPYPFHREHQRHVAQVIFVATPVGRSYKGKVMDARTHRTLLTTPARYTSEALARIAARHIWAERQQVAA